MSEVLLFINIFIRYFLFYLFFPCRFVWTFIYIALHAVIFGKHDEVYVRIYVVSTVAAVMIMERTIYKIICRLYIFTFHLENSLFSLFLTSNKVRSVQKLANKDKRLRSQKVTNKRQDTYHVCVT